MTEQELKDKLNEKEKEIITYTVDFDKTIILMLSAIISVCISLYNKNTTIICNSEVTLFILTISFISISILIGSLKLFSNINSKKHRC